MAGVERRTIRTVENSRGLYRRRGCELHAIAERLKLPDEPARSLLGNLGVRTGPAFLVMGALVQDLPNQTAEPMGDGPDGLGVAESYHQTPWTRPVFMAFCGWQPIWTELEPIYAHLGRSRQSIRQLAH